jgi:hypothetical protein
MMPLDQLVLVVLLFLLLLFCLCSTRAWLHYAPKMTVGCDCVDGPVLRVEHNTARNPCLSTLAFCCCSIVFIALVLFITVALSLDLPNQYYSHLPSPPPPQPSPPPIPKSPPPQPSPPPIPKWEEGALYFSYAALSISLLLIVSLLSTVWRNTVWLLRPERAIMLDLLQLHREYEEIESPQSNTSRLEDSHLDRRLCVVCMDEARTHMFNDCRHVCVCETCSLRLSRCPMCQRDGTTVKVFY